VIYQPRAKIEMSNYRSRRKPNFKYFFEQSTLNKTDFLDVGLDEHEIEKLVEQGILKRNQLETLNLNFVGVIEPSESIIRQTIVVLPKYLKSLNLSNHQLEKHLGLILRALYKYKTSSRNSIHKNTLIFPSNFGSECHNYLALADFFIKDFLKNGIYLKTQLRYDTNSSGRVDWKRTVQRCQILKSKNTQIFTSTIHKRIDLKRDAIISTFHQYVLSQCISLYGDILGYTLHPSIVGEIKQWSFIDQQLSFGTSSILWQTLKKELRLTYGQRNIALIRNLINYIEPLFSSMNSMLIFGTKNFELLWEDVLHTFLDHSNVTSEINHTFPTTEWLNLEQNPIKNSPKGRPIADTIARINHRKYLIADAKYYNLEYNQEHKKFDGKGPGYNDIQKQIFYEKLLTSIYPNVDCTNILIYPIYPKNFDGDILKPFGTVNIPTLGLSPIVNYFGDSEKLLQNYIFSVSADSTFLHEIYEQSKLISTIARDKEMT